MVRRKIKLTRKNLLWAAAALIVVAGALIYFFHHNNKPSATSGTQVKTQDSASSSAGSATTSSPKSSLSGGGSSASGANLISPYGSFVSSHHTSLSSQEESACITSPGATCYIEFTNGDNTRKLSAQTTSSDGNVYWNWKASEIGLFQGSWQIKAAATLNGQTKSTADQIPLEVQP